ncbi:MAG: DNA-3-methyladenine glycosylase 2 family protein, partial [Rhizobiales bacterium]|nr:DNA-3-methyladenine glycosylase 2 family protein [Hyphomicrobiales bacterium]
MSFIQAEEDITHGLAALVGADPRLAPVIEIAGVPPLRRRPHGFEGLAWIVTGQQLSTASAGAIWARVHAAYQPFEPGAIRRAGSAKLARLGLSAGKIRTLKALAKAIDTGELDLAALGTMNADDAHAALIAHHGIGPWTADLYLLSCLGHADAWPAGDLALQEAIRLAFALEARPSTKEMGTLADFWRPWRAVAAR